MLELPTAHPATLMAPAKPLLHIPYAYVMAVTFSLAVGSFFTCISVGVVMHLDVSTRTHCKVRTGVRRDVGGEPNLAVFEYLVAGYQICSLTY